MNPGEIVLIPVPQVGGGAPKLRPALILTDLPGPYQNVLLCGISTQLHLLQTDWDELVDSKDSDYPTSGLHHLSVIRLSYLYAADVAEVVGTLGHIETARLDRLRTRLADRLRP